ncbi:MAG: hypothetical protein ABFQ65_01870 [Nanoarchaeota archaeon]
MDIKGYTHKIGSGVIGFVEKMNANDVVKIANKLAKLKKFKRVLVRRVSERCWGIEMIFSREGDYRNSVLDEISSVMGKVVGKKKVNRWDVSGEIIQIKPKIIR